MTWTDPGDQDRGRVKRRGLPHAKNIDQVDAFSGTPPAPANSGPATRLTDPATSRAAARRAGEKVTQKQLAVLTLFLLYGAMNDEELVDRYQEVRRDIARMPEIGAMIPEQTPSGIRSRRSELVGLNYVVFAGFKRVMKTGGEGNVHRLADSSMALGLDVARRISRR